MAAVTDGGSKEMLPVMGKPVIQWAIDEAFDAGADAVTVVSAPEKNDLNSYLESLTTKVDVTMQFVADGLAPAIALAARPESSLVILPDTLFYPSLPSRRIARALSEGFDIVILTQPVEDGDVKRYGIVEANDEGNVGQILEKPSHTATKSRQAVAARYGLSPRMMGFLLEALDSLGSEAGEIQLTPILNLALRNDYSAIAIPASNSETRFDCGSVDGYRAALEATAS